MTGNPVRLRGTLVLIIVSAALTSVRAAPPNPDWQFTRVVRLTAGFNSERAITPRFAPDGKRIVFNGRRADDKLDAIYLMNPDGTGLIRIYTGDSPVFDPAFAPDGSAICFNAGPSIYEYSLATDSTRRVITDGVWNQAAPVYSRDSRMLLYGSSTGLRLALRSGSVPNPDTLRPSSPFLRQVTANPDDRFPAWSPDGLRIALASLDRAAVSRIYAIPAAGTARLLLTPEQGDFSHPAWSPDGRIVVYHKVIGQQQNLFARDVDTGREGPITSDLHWASGSPDFAPDGKAIVFVRRTERGQDVYLGTLLHKPGPEIPPVAEETLGTVRVAPDSGLVGSDSIADTLAPVADSTPLDGVLPAGRSRYKIVVFAEELAQAHSFLRQLKKLGYDHPDSYAASHPVNRLTLKHNRIPKSVLDEIITLARQYLVVNLTPVDEPNAPENTIYINLP